MLSGNTAHPRAWSYETHLCPVALVAGYNLLKMTCVDVIPSIPSNNDTSEALLCLSACITCEHQVIYQLSAVLLLYFVFWYIDE